MTFKEALAEARKQQSQRPKGETKIMIIHESAMSSAIKDIMSASVLLLAVYINYSFLGNSGWVNFLFVSLFVLMALTHKDPKDMAVFTPEEAWAWMHRNVPRS